MGVLDDLLKTLQEKFPQGTAADPAAMLVDSALAGDDELRWLAERMALARWFDKKLVSDILPEDMRPETHVRDSDYVMGQPVDYVDALINLRFVESLPRQAGEEKTPLRYTFNHSARSLLLKRWMAGERREDLQAASRQFRDLFRRRARQKGTPPHERPILEREALYHQFIANETDAIAKFHAQFHEAKASYQFSVCQALLNLAFEQEPFFQKTSTRSWLAYYQGLLSLLMGEWQAARQQFEAALGYGRHSAPLIGRLHGGLGDVARLEGDWTRAMSEYDASLSALLNLRTYQVVDQVYNAILPAITRFPLPTRWIARPTIDLTRWLYRSEVRRIEINTRALKTPDRLEVARVFTNMAELALAMGQPPYRIAPVIEEMELAARQAAALASPPEGQSGGIIARLRAYSKSSDAYAEASRRRAADSSLMDIVRMRLLDFAAYYFQQAWQILEPAPIEEVVSSAPPDSSDVLSESLADAGASSPTELSNLVWDIRIGLATERMLRRHTADAHKQYEALWSESLPRHDLAELTLAQGDCDLQGRNLTSALERFQQVVEMLKDSWDQATLANAWLRIGYTRGLLGEWESAVEALVASQALFAGLKSPRQEERAQELIREIGRLEKADEPARQSARQAAAGWQAHHFAYTSSTRVIRRVQNLWWPFLFLTSLLVAVPYLLFVRWVGIEILGWFKASQVLDLWWVNLALGIILYFSMLMVMDSTEWLQRVMARLLPLEAVWGSQPAMLRLDSQRMVQVDFTGQTRSLEWDQVTRVRHAYVKDWVVRESGLATTGKPGGRTLVYSQRGALAFDSNINSYFELVDHVNRYVPESKRTQREFETTIRSIASSWGIGLAVGLTMFGCITAAVFQMANTGWWVIVIKVIVAAFMAFMALGLGYLLISQVASAAHLYKFIYPRDLPEPPPPDEVYTASQVLPGEKRSL